jgi:hypothetical protein
MCVDMYMGMCTEHARWGLCSFSGFAGRADFDFIGNANAKLM